jgi:predicted phage terminase large subunit-like protein
MIDAKPAGQVDRKELARHLLKVRAAEESFGGFCDLTRPLYLRPEHVRAAFPDFQKELIDVLDQVERGDIDRLLITMPPRHGKSTFASTLLPVYFLAKNPRRQIIAASYNSELATDFGRKVREIALEPTINQAFPDFQVAADSKAVDKWSTTLGGVYFATGINGTVTGRGADLLIIDDPIKDRTEAESVVFRNKVWASYVSALSTRLLKGGRIVVILTRWHPDDLAGRLMRSAMWKAEGWRHVNFKALTEVESEVTIARSELPKDDPRYIPRLQAVSPTQRYVKLTEERALWPEMFNEEFLRKRRELDPREFDSLYQQSPTLLGGNLIKETWWQFYRRHEQSPIGGPVNEHGHPIALHNIIVAWDTAFKAKELNDYSVGVVAGLGVDGNIYVLDVLRKRFEFPELKRAAIGLNVKYRGRGLVGTYIEDKASGQSLIQELKKESGLSVVPWKTKGDKAIRAKAVTPLIEGGRVFLPEDAPWLDDFITEASAFPDGEHDDQVDALVIALNVLSKVQLHAAEAFSAPINMTASLHSQVHDQKGWQMKLGPLKANVQWKGWGL